MAYKRKTKDVECRKCGKMSRVLVGSRLRSSPDEPVTIICAARLPDGYRCFGSFKLTR